VRLRLRRDCGWPAKHAYISHIPQRDYLAQAMIEFINKYWFFIFGAIGTAAFVWYRFKQTDDAKPVNERLRSLLRGNRYYDPASSSYDPGLFGRQIFLLLLGLPLIALALLIAWLFGN
jgi:hypothetical protein